MKKNTVDLLKLFAIIALFNIGIFAQHNLTTAAWSLTELNGRQVRSSKAFVSFDSSKNGFSGNAGCNPMFGAFSTRGSSIKFSGIGITKMFCGQPGVMNVETGFIGALRNATRYSITGDTLRIYSGRRQVLKFQRLYPTLTGAPVSDMKLEDRKWMLESPKSKASPQGAFVVFDKAKGSAGGNTSCNVFGSSYKTAGLNIAITETISTMRACVEDDRMNVEREFLDGLQKADRFDINGGKLFLYQGQKLLLTFKGQNK